MGIEFSGFDGLAESLTSQANDLANEHFAQELAKVARDRGLDSADGVNLVIDRSEEHGDVKLDEARIRARANEILAAEKGASGLKASASTPNSASIPPSRSVPPSA